MMYKKIIKKHKKTKQSKKMKKTKKYKNKKNKLFICKNKEEKFVKIKE
jgi:hypothetical protein